MIASKYYNKTHEEITYFLDEYQCPYCKHWFMIDISFAQILPQMIMTIIKKFSAHIAENSIGVQLKAPARKRFILRCITSKIPY